MSLAALISGEMYASVYSNYKCGMCMIIFRRSNTLSRPLGQRRRPTLKCGVIGTTTSAA